MALPMISKQVSVEELREQLKGEVLLPGDSQYNAARSGFNLAMNQFPAMIVVARSTEDVVAAVRFANEAGYAIGVKSTGHGGVLPADEAVMIVTSQLTDMKINPEEQTAILGAGLRWGAVLEAAQQHGLAPLLGSSPTVGVIGYTLGGGMGWLARKYGMAVDSVIYFEVVTPAGEVIRASANENSDLFWALRGGGGSFGVVTGMKIRLYPVTEVYAGNLFYPIDQAKAVFERYREWIKQAPEDLTSAVLIMNFPPIPEMPEILRGQSYVMVRGCYAGDVAEGEELLKFWREWQTPVIDQFNAIPFSMAATISNDPVQPMPATGTQVWLSEINDDVIKAMIDFVPGRTPVVFAEIRHAGGAIARGDAASAAFSNREAQHSLQMVGVTPTKEAVAAFNTYTDQIKAATASAHTGGVYPNFVDGEAARKLSAKAFSAENYARLQAIKDRYDPEYRFRFSFLEPK